MAEEEKYISQYSGEQLDASVNNSVEAMKVAQQALDSIGDIDTLLDAINGEKVWVPGLPQVTTSDNGKVLEVVDGEWAASTPSSGGADLPDITEADNGKVLTAVNGKWSPQPPSGSEPELPEVTVEDNGKILTVVDGAWAAAEAPSSGMPFIDLSSAGVIIGTYTETTVTIPDSTGLQLQQAALAGGAVVQMGFLVEEYLAAVKSFCSGSAIPMANAYQLVCKVLLDNWIEISFILNNSSTELAVKSNPVYTLPDPVEGAFLKATGNEWYATIVPDAEGASF